MLRMRVVLVLAALVVCLPLVVPAEPFKVRCGRFLVFESGEAVLGWTKYAGNNEREHTLTLNTVDQPWCFDVREHLSWFANIGMREKKLRKQMKEVLAMMRNGWEESGEGMGEGKPVVLDIPPYGGSFMIVDSAQWRVFTGGKLISEEEMAQNEAGLNPVDGSPVVLFSHEKGLMGFIEKESSHYAVLYYDANNEVESIFIFDDYTYAGRAFANVVEPSMVEHLIQESDDLAKSTGLDVRSRFQADPKEVAGSSSMKEQIDII